MSEVENLEDVLERIFQDEKKINKVIHDLEDISTLGTDDIAVQISELGVGLRITMKLTANCLKAHKIEFKRFKGDVILDLILTPDYPYDNPRILFQNTFCYPTLADGRDFFGSVMKNLKWNSSISLPLVLNEIINYLKVITRRLKDYEFLISEGQYLIGEEYDMEYFLNLSSCELFAAQEIISKKKANQKIISVTQSRLLEFELIKNSNKTAQLVKVEDLKDLVSFGQTPKAKDKRIILKWQLPKKKTRSAEFEVEQDQKLLSVLTERLDQVEKLVQATKKEIAEDEVTIKNYENMDLEQILQNISILESELSETITLSAIDTLMVLYQKAIEFLSAIDNPSYQVFIQKLQELLQREDVQIILKSKENPTSKEEKKENTNQNQKQQQQQQQQTVPIEDFDSIFEDLSQSIIGKNGESSEEVKKRKQEELKAAEILKKYFQHQINVLNTQRYVFIQQNARYLYTEQLFYDKDDKKNIVNVKFNNCKKQEFQNEASARQAILSKSESIVPGILEINKPTQSIIFYQGVCTLKQLTEAKAAQGIKWSIPELLFILRSLLFKLKQLHELKFFLSDIKPATIVTFLKANSAREYSVEFRVNQQSLSDGSKYPLGYTRSYTDKQFIERLRNQEPIADHERVQNELFMLGRTIQYLIVNGNQELLKYDNITQFVSELSEEEVGQTLKAILKMILVDKVVNDLDLVIGEIDRSTEKPSESIKDTEQLSLSVHENTIKEALQQSMLSDIHEKILFEQSHQLNDKASYMINTIGSDNYLLFPLLAHQKQGTLKEILEQIQELLQSNKEKSTLTKSLFDSVIKLIQNDSADSYVLPEIKDISDSEKYIFTSLLLLKGIIYKWNGQVKPFQQTVQFAFETCKTLIGKDHPTYANCLINLAQAESLSSRSGVGLELLVEAYVVRKNLLGNHPSTVLTLLFIAESLQKQSKFVQSLDIYERVMKDFQLLNEKEQTEVCFGKLILSQARTLMLAKKINEAYSLISQAVEFSKETYGEESLQICEAYSETADLFIMKGQLKEALQLNMKSIEIIKNIYGDNHPILADYLVNASYTLRNAKNFDESMNYLIQAMEIRKRYFGENHPIIADTYTEQANTLTYSNQFLQATDIHKLALKIREELYGADNSITLSSLEALVSKIELVKNIIQLFYLKSVLLLVQQKQEEASEYQSKVIDGYDKVFGQDSLQLARFLEKIAFQLEENKSYPEGLPYQRRVLEIRAKNIAQDSNHQYLQCLLNFSYCLDQCSLYEESLKYKKEGLERMKLELGEKHKKIIQQYISIAETELHQNLYQETLESLKQALTLIKEKGLEENETSKCIRTMGSILQQQGSQGNTEGAFEFYNKIMDCVKELLGEQSPFYKFADSICQQAIEQSIQ